MKSRTATLAIFGTLALWAASSAGTALAQGTPERGPAPEAASPEARGGGTTSGAPRQDGRTPAEVAPARPEGDETPRQPGGSCPDQGRKLELIV